MGIANTSLSLCIQCCQTTVHWRYLKVCQMRDHRLTIVANDSPSRFETPPGISPRSMRTPSPSVAGGTSLTTGCMSLSATCRRRGARLSRAAYSEARKRLAHQGLDGALGGTEIRFARNLSDESDVVSGFEEDDDD